MTLTSRSLMWVLMVQHKTSDQYLTSDKVSTRSIQRFKRYRLLKTLTKNFNILSNADTVVTAIALPVLLYRWAKNYNQTRKATRNTFYNCNNIEATLWKFILLLLVVQGTQIEICPIHEQVQVNILAFGSNFLVLVYRCWLHCVLFNNLRSRTKNKL